MLDRLVKMLDTPLQSGGGTPLRHGAGASIVTAVAIDEARKQGAASKSGLLAKARPAAS